ncbi:MAG: hypothetical protein M3R14_04015, partial [Acidobacteriota bacterium]|nr:hypothetical protein [Acidobacteriota bacterium]
REREKAFIFQLLKLKRVFSRANASGFIEVLSIAALFRGDATLNASMMPGAPVSTLQSKFVF